MADVFLIQHSLCKNVILEAFLCSQGRPPLQTIKFSITPLSTSPQLYAPPAGSQTKTKNVPGSPDSYVGAHDSLPKSNAIDRESHTRAPNSMPETDEIDRESHTKAHESMPKATKLIKNRTPGPTNRWLGSTPGPTNHAWFWPVVVGVVRDVLCHLYGFG